jgi:F-type H+-transporting ATPase subunit c
MIDLAGNMLAVVSPESTGMAIFGAVISCGVIIIGAALGIGAIGTKAADAIARQPEAGGRVFMAMAVAAALVEGVTFFALLVCFLTVYWLHV